MKTPEQIIRRCREGIRIFEEVIASLEPMVKKPDPTLPPADEYSIKQAIKKRYRVPELHEAPDTGFLTGSDVAAEIQKMLPGSKVSISRVNWTLHAMGFKKMKSTKFKGVMVYPLVKIK